MEEREVNVESHPTSKPIHHQSPAPACTICTRTFKRKEHLERHMQRHSGAKPFQCHLCTQSFSRRDSMMRHISIHGAAALNSAHLLSGYSKRQPTACKRCALAKQKCEGGYPCDRCVRTNASCSNRSPKTTNPRAASDRMSISDKDEIPDLLNPFIDNQSKPNDRPDNINLSRNTDVTETTSLPSVCTPTNDQPIGSDASLVLPHAEQAFVDLASQDSLWDMDSVFSATFVPWIMETKHDTTTFGSQLENFDMTVDPFEMAWNMTSAQTSNSKSHSPSLPTRLPSHDQSTNAHLMGSQVPAPWTDDLSLPDLSLEDQQAIASDIFGHVQGVPLEPFEKIVLFYCQQNPSSTTFFTHTVFHTFLELYFEHFAEDLDFLHTSVVESDEMPWILLLAVAAVGSQFSVLKQSVRFAVVLQELLHRAVTLNLPHVPPQDDLTWTQIILLDDICLFFGGGKKRVTMHQYQKHTLATFCRAWNMTVQDERLDPLQSSPVEISEQGWHRWLAIESRNRLAHSVYHFESMEYMLIQIRPSLELSEMTNILPQEDSLWKCQSAGDWMRRQRSRQQDLREQVHDATERVISKDNCSRKMEYVFACVEEKLTLERLQKWPLGSTPPFANGAQSKSSSGAPGSIGKLNNLTPGSIGNLNNLISTCVEQKLHSLYPQYVPEIADIGISTNNDTLFPLLALLRRISLTTLHAMSGWQASEEQIKAARASMNSWMHHDKVITRTCLRYAVIIFCTLRSKPCFAHFDAFSLLVASLYIWSYDQLIQAEANPPDSLLTLRLEKPLSKDMAQEWLRGSRNVRIHISGIGILDGVSSPLRTLQEMRRILTTRNGWPEMRHGLARLSERLIQGRRPKFI